MRRCCPDGPLWDALAALQLEVAELRTVVVDAGGGVDSVQSARLEGTGVGPLTAQGNREAGGACGQGASQQRAHETAAVPAARSSRGKMAAANDHSME
jgi:hypothetical protein